jgi:hypothetical protein
MDGKKGAPSDPCCADGGNDVRSSSSGDPELESGLTKPDLIGAMVSGFWLSAADHGQLVHADLIHDLSSMQEVESKPEGGPFKVFNPSSNRHSTHCHRLPSHSMFRRWIWQSFACVAGRRSHKLVLVSGMHKRFDKRTIAGTFYTEIFLCLPFDFVFMFRSSRSMHYRCKS